MPTRPTVKIGEEYGWLTVTEQVESDNFGHRRYLTTCRCGEQRTLTSYLLLHGTQKCEKCARTTGKRSKGADVTGQTFGCWYVVRQHGVNKNSSRQFECICINCGSTGLKTKQELVSSITERCAGCDTYNYVQHIDEDWKAIEGYDGEYRISNYGAVWSEKSGLYLKPSMTTSGYQTVTLWHCGVPLKASLHRLVATAFLDNPNDLLEVNHKDEDKTNNYVGNLEWCNHKYNINYGTCIERISKANRGRKLSEKVRQNQSRISSQHRWVTNGETEKFVWVEDVEKYIKQGWKNGRKTRKRKESE